MWLLADVGAGKCIGEMVKLQFVSEVIFMFIVLHPGQLMTISLVSKWPSENGELFYPWIEKYRFIDVGDK